jgi:hypothetical protein
MEHEHIAPAVEACSANYIVSSGKPSKSHEQLRRVRRRIDWQKSYKYRYRAAHFRCRPLHDAASILQDLLRD